MKTPVPLRTAVVGLGRPGLLHARCIAGMPAEFQFVAGCDAAEERRETFTREHPTVRCWSDATALFKEEAPALVVLATGEVPRCQLAHLALDAGVRALYLEKPLAVSLHQARSVVERCEQLGVHAIVNHQRRTLPVFRRMQQLIASGAIGEVHTVRARCGGDVLCDGTHLVDTARFLLGDPKAEWVAGSLALREPPASLWPGEPPITGWRFGHPVERGASAIVQFSPRARLELQIGSLQPAGTPYQSYEVEGTRGWLRRFGDSGPLIMCNEGLSGWHEVAVTAIDTATPGESPLARAENYRQLAAWVRAEVSDHPLNIRSALAGHEILMGIYESARRHERLTLPLDQPEFPLPLIVASPVP